MRPPSPGAPPAGDIGTHHCPPKDACAWSAGRRRTSDRARRCGSRDLPPLPGEVVRPLARTARTDSRPLLPPRHQSRPHARGHRRPGGGAAAADQARTSPARRRPTAAARRHTRAGDRAPHSGEARTGPAPGPGSTDRRAVARGHPLRARQGRRLGPRRHQEARTHPIGGGWRMHGVGAESARASQCTGPGTGKVGYAYLHSALDGHSRLAYTEALDDEKVVAAVAFWNRPIPSSPPTASHRSAAASPRTARATGLRPGLTPSARPVRSTSGPGRTRRARTGRWRGITGRHQIVFGQPPEPLADIPQQLTFEDFA